MQVMEASGFYRNGVPTSGVFETASLRNNPQQLEKRIKYSAVINSEQLNATAIFELSGSACIYFTQLEASDPNPEELARLHRLSWNHGLAPMLWVVTPTKVLLYNCYSKPTEENRNNPEQHLIELFQQTEDGLKKLNQYASRRQIESGEFWKWVKAKQIDRKQRVDAVLVKDLADTEELLVEDKGLRRSIAQSLLEINPSISDNLRFQEIIGRNLFVSDAFDESAEFNRVEPFAHKQFSAIVGNPPWTKSGATKSASEYCERKRPDVGYPEGYPTAYGTPPDQAFLWRTGDLANQETRIGLVLHGKPFFSPTPQARQAREALLRRFKPQVIINLSKLRNEKLFPKSTAPAMVLIAKNACSEAKDSLYFVCPERSLDCRRHGMLEIGSENIKCLPVIGAASDPDMLKVASWGTARDLSLIQFLRNSFPPLKGLLSQEGWYSGRGFFSGSDGKEALDLYGKKWLTSGEMKKYQVDVASLQPLVKQKLERSRNPEIYKSPLVIATRGLRTSGFFAAFSQEDVVYVDTYIGISIPSDQVNIAHYLNGILNSSLTTYFLFLTGSSWGIERDEVKSQDLERLPIPLPSNNNEKMVNQVIAVEEKLRHFRTETEQESLQQELDEVIFNLYGLNTIEQVLVKDTVDFTIDWFMKREKSKAIKRPQLAELELYAKHLINVIQPFLQTLNERAIVAEVIDVGKAPLQVVKFSIVPASNQQPLVQTISGQKLESVLNRIAEQLPQKLAERIYTRRNLRIYVGEDIYIVKPTKRMYWTRSAGLNDADTILSEYLRTNNASIR